MDYATKPVSTPPHKGKDSYFQSNLFDKPPTAVPVAPQAVATPVETSYIAAFEPVESTPSKAQLYALTWRLVPFHAANFVLGTVAFCVTVTGVCLAIGLLPLCCLGIPVYYGTLHVTRVLAIADVALANTITPCSGAVRLNASDGGSSSGHSGNDLRIAPDLTRVSLRSSLAVLYFATIKFALAILSAVAVWLPILPITSQISASFSSPDQKINNAGWEVHSFNFSTHPVWYTLTCIGFFVGGIVLMHVIGVASRETTRYVCCAKLQRNANATAVV